MRNKVYLWLYLAFTALYAALSLGLPSDPKVLQKYNLTQSRAHIINLGIVVPLLFIFAAALYGFLRFKSFSKVIEGTPEGASFNHIATGLTILAFSLPVLGCIGSLATYASYRNPNLLPMITIFRNYINLLFPLAAFMNIYTGAEGLAGTVKRKVNLSFNGWALLGTIVITSLYIWLITTRTYGPKGDVAYFLPNWLIIPTLAIPYLYIWCQGVAAAYYLNAYQNKIRGKLYKRSLRYLAQGTVGIIVLSICIQLITTSSERLTRLNLSPLLGLIYLLIALYAVGYGLVARGANKLKLIEEV